MSLSLMLGTKPEGLEIKTYGFPGMQNVYLGDYEISMQDFLLAAHYVLTNGNLKHDDPRLQFVRCVQVMHIVEGWGREGTRLDSPLPPAILPPKQTQSEGASQ